MGRIPDTVVDRIYNSISILDIAEDLGLTLKRKGRNWWCLSLFSNEKTPSFAINPDKGIFKDFGASQKGGNAITLIKEMQGMSYREALEYVAEKNGIEIPESDDTPSPNKPLYTISKRIGNYWHKQLLNDWGNELDWLLMERSIPLDVIKEYRVGYAENVLYASQKNREVLMSMVECGLVSYDPITGEERIPFTSRVVFPIFDIIGRIIGFGGRFPHETPNGVAKYINTSNTPIYTKDRVLYGLYQAKRHIRKAGKVIITEGYTDVLGLAAADLRYTVAKCGSALTFNQARVLATLTDTAVLWPDGDEAGSKSLFESIANLLAFDMEVYIMSTPGIDPDDYRKGKDMEAEIEKAIYWVDNFAATINSSEGRAKQFWIKRFCEVATRIGTDIHRISIVRDLAEQINVPEESLFSEIADPEPEIATETEVDVYQGFFSMVLQHPDKWDYIRSLDSWGEIVLHNTEYNHVIDLISEEATIHDILEKEIPSVASCLIDPIAWSEDRLLREYSLMIKHEIELLQRYKPEDFKNQAILAQHKLNVERHILSHG